MNDEQKARVVKRLWELCDGAEPSQYAKRAGICLDLEEAIDARLYLTFVLRNLGLSGYAFTPGDWGPERRTLAGLLAAYIETEL